jgi:hypothetical protein
MAWLCCSQDVIDATAVAERKRGPSRTASDVKHVAAAVLDGGPRDAPAAPRR